MLTTPNLRRLAPRAGWALGLALCLTACTPPGPRALLDGARLLEKGKPTDALRRLRTAVEFLPANPQAWNYLGLAHHANRQPAEAAEAYLHALRLNHNLAPAHFNLGSLWLEQGDAQRAADSLRTFVTLQPGAAEGWRQLAQAQLRLRQWDLAERSFTTALQLTPKDAEAWNGLGVARQHQQRPRDAWQAFTTAVRENPRCAPAWRNLGVLAHQFQALPQAIHAYRQYAELRPDAARQQGIPQLIRALSESHAAASLPSVTPSPPPSHAPEPSPTSINPAPDLTPDTLSPTPTTAAATTPTQPPPALPTTNLAAQSVAPPTLSHPTPGLLAASSPDAPPTNANTNPPPTLASDTLSTPDPTPSLRPPTTASVVTVIAVRPSTPTATSTAPSSIALTTTTSTLPRLRPPPATLRRPEGTVVAVPPPPLEVVEIGSPLTVAETVRDESGDSPAPTPSSLPPISTPARTPATPLPEADRSFWGRANPLRWFDPEPAPTPAPTPLSSTPSSANTNTNTNVTVASATPASPDDATRRRWGNPLTWFRSDEPPPSSTPIPAPEPEAAVASPAPVTSMSSLTTPPPSTNAPILTLADVRVGASPMPDRSAPPAPTPTPTPVRRYQYLRPEAPAPGNRSTARVAFARALVEHRRGRLDNAVAAYQEALREDPSFFDAEQNLSAAHLEQDDLPQSLAASERALVLRPDSDPARLNFALALDRAGFPVDAAAEAQRIAERQPDDIAAHLLLGNLYAQKLNDPARARTHYLRVIELSPEHPESLAIRRWLANPR